MYDSQLIQIFKSLSRTELNNLYFFIDSYFNFKGEIKEHHKRVSKELIFEFYKILKDNFPEFNSETINRKNIFKKLFPDEIFDDLKFRTLLHELTHIIELYLSYLDILAEPVHSRIHLIEQIEKRKIWGLMDIKINELDMMLNKSEFRDEDYFMQKYLNMNKKWLNAERKIYIGKSEENFNIFNEEINYTLNCFLILLLKQLGISSHLKSHLKINFDVNLHEKIFNVINENDILLANNPVLSIYYKILKIQRYDIGSKEIEVIMKLLIKNEKLFKELDYKYLFIDLLNTCYHKFNNNEKMYKEIFLEIYKYCIAKQVYVQNGIMHEHNYTGMTAIGLRLDRIKTTEDFIRDNKENLIPEHRENAYYSNYAIFYNKIKKYRKALEMLGKVKSKDIYYSVGIYNLETRIYYELGYFEEAFALVDSYKHFLRTKTLLPKEYSIRYSNFLKYYEKLLKIKTRTSKILVNELMSEINKTKELSFKKWLIEKAEELTKKRGG